MPQIAPAIIAAIIGAAATTATTVYSGVNANNQADDARKAATEQQALQAKQLADQQAQQKVQTDTTAKATIAHQFPDLQALTGGGLSPEAFASFGATQSGNADQMNIARQLAQQFFGGVNASQFGSGAAAAGGQSPLSGSTLQQPNQQQQIGAPGLTYGGF